MHGLRSGKDIDVRAPSARHLAVDIEPAPVAAYEAAALVQAHAPAVKAAAGHEFDLGVIGGGCIEGPDAQPQPFNARFESKRGRAVGGFPGGKQVIGPPQHIGAIARAHQAFGVGRGRVFVVFDIAPAAVHVAERFLSRGLAARAGGVRLEHGFLAREKNQGGFR